MEFWLAYLLLLAYAAPAHSTSECPLGSIHDSAFNKCYKLSLTPKTFLAAEQECNSIGGHLADVQSVAENYFISGIASGTSLQELNFWIGANVLMTGSWSWTSNAPMTYTNWAGGQPTDGAMCAFANYNHTWASSSCTVSLPFVCEVVPKSGSSVTPAPTSNSRPTTTTTTSTPSSSTNCTVCTDGYTRFEKNCKCYKYFSAATSFANANETCTNKGGMLAKISDYDVNDFLVSLSPDISSIFWPYIGLTCTGRSSSSCSWADGTPLGSFQKLVNVQPYNFALATTRGRSDTGKWYNMDSDQPFICEKN